MKELEIRTMENTKQEVKKGEVLQNGLKNRYKCRSNKRYIQTNCKMKTKQIKEKNHKIKQEVFKIKARISNNNG